MRQAPRYDVFLAYSAADEQHARELHRFLAPRHSVFFDRESLRPGEHWDTALAEAQQVSRVTVVLVSGNTGPSFYQREEIVRGIALSRESKSTHRVIPVYLELAKVPYGLQRIQGIVLGARGLKDVARKIKGLLDELKTLQSSVVTKPRRQMSSTNVEKQLDSRAGTGSEDKAFGVVRPVAEHKGSSIRAIEREKPSSDLPNLTTAGSDSADRVGVTVVPETAEALKARFLDVLRAETRRRLKRPMCIAIMDIDKQTAINRIFGPEVGNLVIKETEALLSLWMGQPARKLGGDSFYMILSEESSLAMQKLVVVLKSLKKHKWSHIARTLYVTCSIGIAEWHHGESVESLANRAVEALRTAKQNGGNLVAVGPMFSDHRELLWHDLS